MRKLARELGVEAMTLLSDVGELAVDLYLRG